MVKYLGILLAHTKYVYCFVKYNYVPSFLLSSSKNLHYSLIAWYTWNFVHPLSQSNVVAAQILTALSCKSILLDFFHRAFQSLGSNAEILACL
jgi:hypothetical protein